MSRKQVVLWLTVIIATLSSCQRQPSYPAAPRQGADVVIDISGLRSETPVFYTYRYQDKKINFFICKVQDKVLSFLDACASCYTHKRGYRADEGQVTCRDCGMKFSMHQLEKGLGSCYPIKIEGRMEDGKYVIPVSALEASADKF